MMPTRHHLADRIEAVEALVGGRAHPLEVTPEEKLMIVDALRGDEFAENCRRTMEAQVRLGRIRTAGIWVVSSMVLVGYLAGISDNRGPDVASLVGAGQTTNHGGR